MIGEILLLLLYSHYKNRPNPGMVDKLSPVEWEKYAGTWHEIASIPQWFQRYCSCSTATYKILPDGTVSVVNSCEWKGDTKVAEGTATIVPGSNGRRALVSFNPFSKGDYWILYVDPDYRTALVGYPFSSLWILSRTKELPQAEIDALLKRAEEMGFDISKIKFTC